MVDDQRVDVGGEAEGPEDGHQRGEGREHRLRYAEVFQIAARHSETESAVVPVMIAALTDVGVKVHCHPDEVTAGHAEVGHREMDENLTGFCSYALDQNVGEDNQEGPAH